MKNKLLGIVVLGSVLLHGCSSTPQEIQADLNASKIESQQEARDSTLDNIPDWYLGHEPVDETGFYAAGTAYSDDLEGALEIAKLEASRKLAENYKQSISGVSDLRRSTSGDGKVKSAADAYTKKVVDAADLSGSSVLETEVFSEKAGFRAYVLMYLPYDSINTVKSERKKTDNENFLKSGEAKLNRSLGG